MRNSDLLKQIENYYTEKIKVHGVSAKGVDWNSVESQELRFSQLLKLIDPPSPSFSLLDYGCGYGALLDYMKSRYPSYNYLGFDISREMLGKANELNPSGNKISWVQSLENEVCDYTVASGIFNVRLEQQDAAWKDYIEATIIDMDKRSQKGFAFNMLTSYSDKEYMRDYLFYGSPAYYFDFCKRKFSKQVALLHDYTLYEFTIIVRKLSEDVET